MLIIQIFTIFVLTILNITDAVTLHFKSMECMPNKEVCFDNICNVRTNSAGQQFFDFGCNFKDVAQENMVINLVMYRKEGSDYKQFLINKTDEVCSSNNAGLSSTIGATLKCGNFFDPCPAKGNRTLVDCPVAMTSFPGIVPTGEYRTNSRMYNTHTNKEIISTVSYFTLS